MTRTKIQWADRVWNPVTGCKKVSDGCANCYAERFTKRLQQNPKTSLKYANGFHPTFHPEELSKPYGWPPSTIFVGSMGDIFLMPYKSISLIIKVIKENPQHRFMILTKRAFRMREFFCDYLGERHNIFLHSLPNLYLGVSVENETQAYERITHLLMIPCLHRFISCEPFLGPVSLTGYDIRMRQMHQKGLKDMIDLIIIGGETGPLARETELYQYIEFIQHCDNHKITVFFKGFGKHVPDLDDPEYSCLRELIEEKSQMPNI